MARDSSTDIDDLLAKHSKTFSLTAQILLCLGGAVPSIPFLFLYYYAWGLELASDQLVSLVVTALGVVGVSVFQGLSYSTWAVRRQGQASWKPSEDPAVIKSQWREATLYGIAVSNALLVVFWMFLFGPLLRNLTTPLHFLCSVVLSSMMAWSLPELIDEIKKYTDKSD